MTPRAPAMVPRMTMNHRVRSIMGRPSKQTPEPSARSLSPLSGVSLVAWCQ
jgi:hypothetical protein